MMERSVLSEGYRRPSLVKDQVNDGQWSSIVRERLQQREGARPKVADHVPIQIEESDKVVVAVDIDQCTWWWCHQRNRCC